MMGNAQKKKQKNGLYSQKPVSVLQILKLFSNNTYALFVIAIAFELNNAVSEREKGIVRTNADIGAGMYVSTSLTNDDVTCENGLTVGFLNTESLRTAITAVLCRTYTFFMCKEL